LLVSFAPHPPNKSMLTASMKASFFAPFFIFPSPLSPLTLLYFYAFMC
jgi:hypothetical protein